MTSTRAMLVALAAIFCGCLMDTLIKFTAQRSDALLWVIAWRYLIGTCITLSIFILLRKRIPGPATLRFQSLRGVVAGLTGLFFFYGLTQLALTEGIVLGFSAALMIGPIAWLLLGERISATSLGATLLGFVGVGLAVMAHPEGAPQDANRLLGTISIMAAACGYALSLVMLRMRAAEDDSLTIVTFSNVIPAVMYAPFLFGGDMQMLIAHGPYLISAGIMGVAIWWLMSIAYANAQAQTLAPLEYTALIWASMLGWAVFSERPAWMLYVGAVVIIIACLIVAFDSHFRTRKETRMPVSDIME